jgi:hypothetical protein
VIEGKEKIHRLARTLELALREFYLIEDDFEPMANRAQASPTSITISVEGYATEEFVITITQASRKADWKIPAERST